MKNLSDLWVKRDPVFVFFERAFITLLYTCNGYNNGISTWGAPYITVLYTVSATVCFPNIKGGRKKKSSCNVFYKIIIEMRSAIIRRKSVEKKKSQRTYI